MFCGASCAVLQMSEPDVYYLCQSLDHFQYEIKCSHTDEYFKKQKNFLHQYKKEMLEWKCNENKLSEETILLFKNATNGNDISKAIDYAKQEYRHLKAPIEDFIFKIYQRSIALGNG